MKETIVGLLQQRMDKCTNEQYWAVASVTATDAIVISSRQEFTKSIPTAAIVAGLSILTTYGVVFVIQRHVNYYRLRRDLATVLQGEPVVPDFLKRVPGGRTVNSLSGVVFYVLWMVIAWMATFVVVT
ncbi:MAG TPA: hypothetical protein VG897_03430 [Terriglobales bacterium]|nr:hypothetical protein [Terriglobales bacterium]